MQLPAEVSMQESHSRFSVLKKLQKSPGRYLKTDLWKIMNKAVRKENKFIADNFLPDNEYGSF